MKTCITTFVTANYFQYYIPLFVYSINRAYPKTKIKIFIQGELKESIKPLLGRVKIFENMFSQYQGGFHANALRFLLSDKHFKNYRYTYFTDVDFLVFKHTPSLFAYMGPLADKYSYAGFRGIGKDKMRMAGGAFMVTPQWFAKTQLARHNYKKSLKKSKSIDRKYDEEMLYNICKASRLPVPIRNMCFQNGKEYNRLYRDIHLGDFKFTRRIKKKSKMSKRLVSSNISAFREMSEEEGWKRIYNEVKGHHMIHDILSNFKLYLKRR